MLKLVLAMSHKVRLWTVPEWFPERIRAACPGINVVPLVPGTSLDQELADADVFAGVFLKPEQLAAAARLRWIHVLAAGVNQILTPELAASPVVVTNSSSVMAEPVAEHGMALILALAKRIPSAVRYQREAHWAQDEIYHEDRPIPDLAGSTLGIVGLGAIGRELSMRARAFGMRVLGVKRDPTHGREDADRLFSPEQLGTLLAESDFVMLCTPATPSTQALIGAAEFAAMKPSAYFINLARGTLIDEAALVEALRARRIAGAAIDVAVLEPLPAESPLWTAPGLLLTPHLAGSTAGLWRRHERLLVENVRRFEAGEELLNTVDKHGGY